MNKVLFIGLLLSIQFSFSQELPFLRFSSLIAEIDEYHTVQLDSVYQKWKENPKADLMIISFFEHEKDITPFIKRAKLVQEYLITLGVNSSQIDFIVARRSEYSIEDASIDIKFFLNSH